MKKIVFLSLFTLCLPLAMMAQSNDDDLYFIPSKDKDKEVKTPAKKAPAKREVTTIYTAPGSTVVIQDRKGNTRDVDEYNRRYDSRDNEFAMENDTLYIKEKAQRGLDGEWVNGEFNGSQDDYEYAERIIRFRNPRYAISISSPFYWDVVYGANSWDWNVYTDGLYAYAFPTFSNRLWWNWRFNSFGGGWGSPYYGYGWGGYPGYWGGYYGGYYGGYWGGGYWGGGWGHHHHYPGYYPGWGGGGHYWADRNTYTNRTYSGRSDYGNSSSARRYGSNGSVRSDRSTGTSTYTRGDQNSSRRIIGTRNIGERNGISTRTDGSSSRNSIYTRPSSTRGNSSIETSRNNGSVSTPGYSEGGRRASSRSSSTYSRGSSTAPERSSSAESSRRSYTPERSSSSSSRSYSSPSGSSSRSYSTGGGGGGSSSRSSGGGGGSSRSRR